ncbi:MAG: antibiotic biosynthesis monooxygenase (ABM) superfamily enzyme [Colwellia polaris]|jgi:antibiotic biosynthesis monooxygenase (ABM) superfamily enzyme
MISVTFLALFPIINLLSFLLSPYILWLPTTLRLAIIIILTLILMSYVVMPVMHRTFSFWLKPT